jgi:hypothetical protein
VLSVYAASEGDSVSVAVKHKKKVSLIAIKNDGNEEIFGFKIKIDDGNIRYVKAKGWDRERIDSSTVLLETDDRPITGGRNQIILLIIDNKDSNLVWAAFDFHGKIVYSQGLLEDGIEQEEKTDVEISKPSSEFKGMSYTMDGNANCDYDDGFISCDVLAEVKPIPRIETPVQLQVTWKATPSGDAPMFFNWEFGIIGYNANTGVLENFYKCTECYGNQGNGFGGSQIITIVSNLKKEETYYDPFTGMQLKLKQHLGFQVNTSIEKWTVNVKELPPIGSENSSANSHLNVRISITDSFWVKFAQGHTFEAYTFVNDVRGNDVANANINAVIQDPFGNEVQELSTTTDSTGKGHLTWRIPNDAELGIYTITVTATKEQMNGTYSKSFEVVKV